MPCFHGEYSFIESFDYFSKERDMKDISINGEQRRRFTLDERRLIYRQWQKGWTYAELARRHATRRQNTRAIVLSFSPRLEDYRMHDYHWRERLFGKARCHRPER